MVNKPWSVSLRRRIGTNSLCLLMICAGMLAMAGRPQAALGQRSGTGSIFDGPASASDKNAAVPRPRDRDDAEVQPAAEPAKEPAADDARDPPAEPLHLPQYTPAAQPAADDAKDLPAAPTRLPEPAPPAQAAAEKLIRNLFRSEYASSLPADRQALSRKLLEQGKQTSDDPIARFVCLREARDLAATAFDLDLAMQAVAEIARYYQVDEFELRFKTLQLANGGGASPATCEAIANAGVGMIDTLILADDYDKALRVSALADTAASRTRRPEFVAHVKESLRRLQSLRMEYEKVKASLAVLQKNPSSADAATTVGRFYCLNKGDWEKGLPYLKKCSDAPLASLAARDLARPTESKDQLDLADAWWALAEKSPAPFRNQMALRAGTWYRAALPQLAGLNQTRVKARLEALDKLAVGPASRVDLMTFIDPGKDAISGTWQFQDGALLSERVPRARLQVPYEPPEEYDFRVVFTRLQGSHDVAQMLVGPEGTSFAWVMAAFSNLRCGFSSVDRLSAYNNATTVRLNRSLENGQQHTSVVQVRRDGVRAYLDGELISELRTDYKNVSSDFSFTTREPRLLGVGTADSVTAFHAIEVMEISGKGKRTR